MSKNAHTDLVSVCRNWLEMNHIPTLLNHTGAVKRGNRLQRYGRKGSSDIIGILPGGKFLAIECKTGSGRLTRDQRAFLDDVNAMGAVGVVVRSLEELVDQIGHFRKHWTVIRR